MSLPQLIGLTCVTCRKNVGSIVEAQFCEKCGNPVHLKCTERNDPPPAERCAKCGGDPESDIAKEVRRERGGAAQIAASRHGPVAYPVSSVCPNCKSDKFTRVRPQGWIAFAYDRVCSECGMCYSPPTPMWAAIAFLVAGLALTGLGLLGLAAGDAFVSVLGLLGFLAIIHGLRCFAQPGKI